MKKEMPKKWFYKHLLSSEYDGSLLVKGRFYEDGKIAKIHDGAVVSIGDLEAHSVYSAVKDLDVRKITAPISTSDEIGIVDLVNVSEGRIGDNTYREGIKTIGLTVDAGIPVRVRRLKKGDSFYSAKGNFIGEVQEGKFAIPTKGDTKWTIVDNATVGTTAIKIDFILPLVEGTVITDDKILCTVTQIACPSGASGSAVTTEQIEDGAITLTKLSDDVKDIIDEKAGQVDENKSEVFNDYENNKIYGQYSHIENKVGIVGNEENIDKLIASHFENVANVNITPYYSMFLLVQDKNPIEFHGTIPKTQYQEDKVQVGDIIVAELSEKAKFYAVVSRNASYSYEGSNDYYLVYQFEEFYLTDGFSFTDSIDDVKILVLRYDSKAKGYSFIEIGKDHVLNSIENAHGEGSTIITDSYQHGEGYNTRPYGKGSHTEGKDTVTFGDYCHAEGNGSAAFGFSAHAEGSETRAIGSWSHAEGKVSYAYAPFSHAEGSKTKAMKQSSHSEGDQTIANGNGAHAEGQSTQANGDQSHAEGSGSIAQGFGSHAEGVGTKATGTWSHSEGYQTEASADTAHAEGYTSKATAIHSHAEGQGTLASGEHSHSEGIGTIASGIDSHAEGCKTVAQGRQQHVQGRYNVIDEENKYAHIVGNGNDAQRKNIHTIDWNGNTWYQGKVLTGGTSAQDAKEVATVDIKLTALELIVDAEGKVTGGTATLANGNTIAVTIKTV